MTNGIVKECSRNLALGRCVSLKYTYTQPRALRYGGDLQIQRSSLSKMRLYSRDHRSEVNAGKTSKSEYDQKLES